jgi:trigger factor
VVLEDNVVEHVLSQAKVSDEEVAFDQIMGTN